MEATRRGGLRERTCQTAVTNKRKDSQRKPLLPHLRVAEVAGSVFNSLFFYCQTGEMSTIAYKNENQSYLFKNIFHRIEIFACDKFIKRKSIVPIKSFLTAPNCTIRQNNVINISSNEVIII